MSRLAELLDVSLSNATGIVDRMEERGLVERVRVPDDRRVVLVRIGPQRASDALRRDRGAEAGPASGDPRPSRPRPSSIARGCGPRRHPKRGRRRVRSRLSRRPRPHPASPTEGRGNQLMESIPAERGGFEPTLADDPALGLPLRAKMEILFAVMLGLFLGALDQTIVGPALPTIVTELAWQRPLRLGRHDLPADQHDQRPVLGQAVRPLRPQADVHDRHRHLPGRLGPVRPLART